MLALLLAVRGAGLVWSQGSQEVSAQQMATEINQELKLRRAAQISRERRNIIGNNYFVQQGLKQLYRGGDILEVMPHLSSEIAGHALDLGIPKEGSTYTLATAHLSTQAMELLIENSPKTQVIQYSLARFDDLLARLRVQVHPFGAFIVSCAFLQSLDGDNLKAFEQFLTGKFIATYGKRRCR